LQFLRLGNVDMPNEQREALISRNRNLTISDF
jgi:hypothetical protein